ncbi:MAG: UDP-N-acetylmuramate--L-alanine ligase [Candidatus Marinimicrobia bacterium]|nr:UDP-N-acetylmuramate--L-alanine ligase [Candidatus Neomarinimicrobiota bacterium]
MNTIFKKTRKIHFIGIGGIGMCGIAELLKDWGFDITGSDMNASENTYRLESLGIPTSVGHRKENVPDCDVVVYSSAVQPDNPERVAALERQIPVIRRAEMLGEIFKLKPTRIAISGTHGKTTTTSMIGQIFIEAGADPVIIAGGIVGTLGTTTRSGKGNVIIVEADEFDRSFLKLYPTDTVITTIEAEHLDCYDSLEEIEKTFMQFANETPFFGSIVACIDEKSVRKILPDLKKPVVTVGLDADADIRAERVVMGKGESSFDVIIRNKLYGHIRLFVPGIHNVKNALSAIGVAWKNDIPFDVISSGLSKFRGVRRRFEIVEENDLFMLVDDYGHHPTEIRATLNAAKSGWNRRIIAVFQPHLFTRTRDFYQDFASALMLADVAVILDVYPSREKPIEGITGKIVADAAKQIGHPAVEYIKKKIRVPEFVESIAKKGDMIVSLGAGDVNRLLPEISKRLSKKFECNER